MTDNPHHSVSVAGIVVRADGPLFPTQNTGTMPAARHAATLA